MAIPRRRHVLAATIVLAFLATTAIAAPPPLNSTIEGPPIMIDTSTAASSVAPIPPDKAAVAWEPFQVSVDFGKIHETMSGIAWFTFIPGTTTPLTAWAANFCAEKVGEVVKDQFADRWQQDLCTLKVLTTLLRVDPSTTGVEATEANALELLGPTLVLPVRKFTPNEAMGRHKLHVSIELPLEVDLTPAQEAARAAAGWPRGDDPPAPEEGEEPKKPQYDWVEGRTVVRREFAVQMDPWKDTTESAAQIAEMLGLWRVNDRLAIVMRLNMERTRKSIPVDGRLRRASDAPPVVSFDEFLPAMEAGHYTGSGTIPDPLVWHSRLRSTVAAPFAIHTNNILFDSNRVKVAGAFRPSHVEGYGDGDLCLVVNHAVLGGCWNATYRLTFTDYATMKVDPGALVTLATVMRRKSDGQIVGESTAVEMYSGGWLKPEPNLYLDLLKSAVTGWLYLKGESDNPERALPGMEGWSGHTMIGAHRIDALQVLIEREILAKGVPGGLFEAGAWRGGAAMFMKGVLRAHGEDARRVFVADSFQGFPLAAEEDKKVDSDGWFHENSAFNVDGGGAEVRATFKRYGLWDEQVTILAGYFNDSLPYAATNGYLDGGLALIRMDCDMYRSTMDVLDTLWPYLSKGGIVAHNNFEYTAPRTAVVEFRRKHGLQRLPIHIVDDNAMFFVKE